MRQARRIIARARGPVGDFAAAEAEAARAAVPPLQAHWQSQAGTCRQCGPDAMI
jgi:hypothetical protein